MNLIGDIRVITNKRIIINEVFELIENIDYARKINV